MNGITTYFVIEYFDLKPRFCLIMLAWINIRNLSTNIINLMKLKSLKTVIMIWECGVLDVHTVKLQTGNIVTNSSICKPSFMNEAKNCCMYKYQYFCSKLLFQFWFPYVVLSRYVTYLLDQLKFFNLFVSTDQN